ncbi:mitochondrial transcription termination factorfamily protein [Striga asiatica]|uniref:Mitochondrial transcription termination factorfamily protein n=1 Tax=Striga asiatica TaxID=4170 RepID=A0A5A7R5J6_STRAF|nr:mitochondrial transcription termination factorfamily protein [Striga asiatica]
MSSSSHSYRLTVVSFFNDLGLDEKAISKTLARCPEIFAASIDETLKKKLEFLSSVGISETHLPRVIRKYPELFVCDVDRALYPRVRYLMEVGFSESDIVSMLHRFSPTLGYSVEENLKPKLEFLVNNMQRPLSDVVAYPRYFSYSMEKKIRPRPQEYLQKLNAGGVSGVEPPTLNMWSFGYVASVVNRLHHFDPRDAQSRPRALGGRLKNICGFGGYTWFNSLRWSSLRESPCGSRLVEVDLEVDFREVDLSMSTSHLDMQSRSNGSPVEYWVLKGKNVEFTLKNMLGINDEEFAAAYLELGEMLVLPP